MAITTLLDDTMLSAIDYRCEAHRGDKPFAELHGGFDLAYVREGSFSYHARGETYELVAGSVLIGHRGDEYVCSHDHARGSDRCLSFQFDPALLETIGPWTDLWRSGALAPSAELMVLGELAQAASADGSDVGLEEAAMLFAGRLMEMVSGRSRSPFRARPHERGRAVDAALRIDEFAHTQIRLADLAGEAGLSPFHFLRLFANVVGVTRISI